MQIAPRTGKDACRAVGRSIRSRGPQQGKMALQQGKTPHNVVDDDEGTAALAKGRAAKDGKGLGQKAPRVIGIRKQKKAK